MVIRPYLAMTAREFHTLGHPNQGSVLCCLDPFGPGLLPGPGNCPLVFTDRVEPVFHPVSAVHQALAQRCSGFLLADFQRACTPWHRAFLQQWPTSLPLVVPGTFASLTQGPVLLSWPPDTPLEEVIAPWKGREIWLEMDLRGIKLTLTEEGCQRQEASVSHREDDLWDETLLCHYRWESTSQSVLFSLSQTKESWQKRLAHAQTLGIHQAIGLLDEFGL